MNRKIKFAPGNYYHIYDRGVEKRKIFLEVNDYQRFLLLLSLCNGRKAVITKEYFQGRSHFQHFQGRTLEMLEKNKKERLVDIGAYCLMPNHFHLLTKEKSENGITNFMRKLNTAYAMYFNKKNNRSGSLFQGRFGAELLDDDNYLKYIFAYIHLNPIKLIDPTWKDKRVKDISRIKKFLNNYQWSSYTNYTKGENNNLLDRKAFPEYFKNIKDFQDFIDIWLDYGVTKVGP